MPKRKTSPIAKTTTTEPIKTYVPEKNLKIKVVEDAVRSEYKCLLDPNGVVMFDSSDNNDEIRRWLVKKYSRDGKTIPFSYGFAKINFIAGAKKAETINIETE